MARIGACHEVPVDWAVEEHAGNYEKRNDHFADSPKSETSMRVEPDFSFPPKKILPPLDKVFDLSQNESAFKKVPWERILRINPENQ